MDKCSDRQRLVNQPVFKEFLVSNAPTLYKNILDSILSEHHGDKRANLQEKRATALIWQLLYYRYFHADHPSRPITFTVFQRVILKRIMTLTNNPLHTMKWKKVEVT